MLLSELERDQVVLVVAGDCKHGVSALHAGGAEEPHLVAVASHDDTPELALRPVRAGRVLLDQRHLVAALQEVSGEVVAHLASADDDCVHGGQASVSMRRTIAAPSMVGQKECRPSLR